MEELGVFFPWSLIVVARSTIRFLLRAGVVSVVVRGPDVPKVFERNGAVEDVHGLIFICSEVESRIQGSAGLIQCDVELFFVLLFLELILIL